MRKINKKRVSFAIVAFILLLGIVFGITKGITYVIDNSKKLELIGDANQTIMLHSVYDDPGVNLPEAKVEGKVDTSKAGVYELSYTYKKQNVTRYVKVLDNKQIVMNLNGSADTYVKQNQKYIESGCHVIDQTEGNITNQVKIDGNVDTSKPGQYEVTYRVANKDGVECVKKRTVHVVAEKDFKENIDGVPVLMYHYVYTKDDIPENINTNYLLNTDLEEQLDYLTSQNYYFPSYKELYAYINGEIDLPEKSIILTFDDGKKNFLEYGIPLLEKYKVPATSFFIASKNGEDRIKTYASEYISFQSHSYNMHIGGGYIGHGGIISALTKDEIKSDLVKAQEIVQNTEAFAYPYGDITEEAKQAVQEVGILCSFSTEYGKVNKGDDNTSLKRVRVLGDASLESFIASIE